MEDKANFEAYAEDSEFHGLKQVARADNGYVSRNKSF